MNATPRSGRLSSPGQVAAILVGSALTSIAVLAAVIALFVTVVIPGFEFGGKDQIPSDLPIYPGAQLQSAFASGSQGCTTVSATWSASAPASDVIDFYKSQLNAGAWTLTLAGASRGEFDLDFESTTGAHREGVIIVSSDPSGRTDITLELVKSTSTPKAVSSCHLVVGRIG
jgi:hypothetical protein